MAARTGAKPEEYYVAVLGMGGVGKSSFITQVLFQPIITKLVFSS
jgi:GTPase SAR1 family protein